MQFRKDGKNLHLRTLRRLLSLCRIGLKYATKTEVKLHTTRTSKLPICIPVFYMYSGSEGVKLMGEEGCEWVVNRRSVAIAIIWELVGGACTEKGFVISTLIQFERIDTCLVWAAGSDSACSTSCGPFDNSTDRTKVFLVLFWVQVHLNTHLRVHFPPLP